MSFVATYHYTGEPAAVYREMTAVVGEDGRLYWLRRDVDEALGRSEERGSTATRRSVRRVTRSSRFPFPARLADEEVLSHPETTESFRTAPDAGVRRFGELLDDPRTRLLSHVPYDVTRLGNPVYVRLLEPDPDEASSYFGVWCHFFREAALAKLYAGPRDWEIYRAVVELAIPPRSDVRPFPKEIVFDYRGSSVTYVPRSPVPADSDEESVLECSATETTSDEDSATEIATSATESDGEDF